MSDITISRPEVVTGHTDVICSTSIRHVVTVRNAALQQTETLIRQLAEISVLTAGIGGKTALDWAMKQNFRCGCWLMEKPEAAMKAITRNLDREISSSKILRKFEELHQYFDDVFERGVIIVLRGLNWNYKTNCPCKFGSKIIVNNLVRWDRWG